MRTTGQTASWSRRLFNRARAGPGSSKFRYGGNAPVLHQMLDKAAQRVGGDLQDQPQLQAELRFEMGQTFHSIGKNPEAERMCREAFALCERIPGEDSATARVLRNLGDVLSEQGRFAEAEEVLRKALSSQTQSRSKENPDWIWSLASLLDVLQQAGNRPEFERLFKDSLANLPQDDTQKATLLRMRGGWLYPFVGRWELGRGSG